MSEEKNIRDIADASVPNAGRIYDYLLGGHHNFEVDRQVAEKALELAPFLSKTLRLIRWFLGKAIRMLVDEGYDKFVDFASGLPAMDHIHQVAPKGTRVIYSDIDPVTVAYANDIIGDDPNIRYVPCDAAKPEELLKSAVIDELFGTERRVAIGFNGISYFLSDETIQHALKILYDWADEGSKLFLSDADADPSKITDKMQVLFDLYSKIGQPIYVRTKEKLVELAKPWKIDEPGILPLDEWIDIEKVYTDEERSEYGGQGFYGVIFKK
jgi:hypothetical protein